MRHKRQMTETDVRNTHKRDRQYGRLKIILKAITAFESNNRQEAKLSLG